MTQKFIMVEDLQKSTFDPYLEQKFLVHLGESKYLEVELVSISEKKYQRSEIFSLLFRGPFNEVLAQSMYRMEHPEIGTFELFLVPVMVPRDGGIHYEAVFNRLI